MSIQLKLQDTRDKGEEDSSKTAQYKINYYGADFTLEVLNSKLKNGEIKVTSFQRKYVWTVPRASRLIESFLLGLPVPQIFLYKEEKTQNLLVVDGHQRLKTIQAYFSGRFEDRREFRLTGVKNSINGKCFTELSKPEQRYLKNSVLRATIFEQADPKDTTSMFEVFNRLNTGGMPLSYQEIRNCIYGGPFNEMLKTLNFHPKWRSILRSTEPDKRMRDIEIILKFFTLKNGWQHYSQTAQSLRDFMTDFMAKNRDINPEEVREYSTLFKSVVDTIHDQIGPNALKIKSGAVNTSVFDSIAVALSEIGLDNVSDLRQKYRKLIQNQEYIDDVSDHTTNTEKVQGRIKLALGILR